MVAGIGVVVSVGEEVGEVRMAGAFPRERCGSGWGAGAERGAGEKKNLNEE